MDRKQTSLAHRIASVLILLVLICLFGLVIASLLSQQSERQQRYESLQFQLDKYTALIARLPRLNREHQHLLTVQKNDKRYLVANKASLAAAQLQKKVQRTLAQSAAQLISMQVIKTRPDNGFQAITLKLQFQATHTSLLKCLYQLKNSQAAGFIYKLHIQQAFRPYNKQTSKENALDISMEYTAFMVIADES